MARRVKQEPSVHRAAIAEAAQSLFMKKGIEHTSMNEIANVAGYSKATIYVYFKDKESLVGYLVLQSMRKLYEYLENGIKDGKTFKEKYINICWKMAEYEREYPYYFRLILRYIDFDPGNYKMEDDEYKTIQVGEKINWLILNLLEEYKCELKSDEVSITMVFSLWGMLSGLIQLASEKELYIKDRMGVGREDFLNEGFELLYSSLVS